MRMPSCKKCGEKVKERRRVFCSRKCSLKNLAENNTQHGESRTPEHTAWVNMKARCYDPRNKRSAAYKQRGIAVCEEWRDNYRAFLEHMGRRPSDQHSLERVDNSKGYEPGNCVWALQKAQSRNTTRNRFFPLRGMLMCLEDCAEEIGITPAALIQRLDNWSEHRALTEPRNERCVSR